MGEGFTPGFMWTPPGPFWIGVDPYSPAHAGAFPSVRRGGWIVIIWLINKTVGKKMERKTKTGGWFSGWLINSKIDDLQLCLVGFKSLVQASIQLSSFGLSV